MLEKGARELHDAVRLVDQASRVGHEGGRDRPAPSTAQRASDRGDSHARREGQALEERDRGISSRSPSQTDERRSEPSQSSSRIFKLPGRRGESTALDHDQVRHKKDEGVQRPPSTQSRREPSLPRPDAPTRPLSQSSARAASSIFSPPAPSAPPVDGDDDVHSNSSRKSQHRRMPSGLASDAPSRRGTREDPRQGFASSRRSRTTHASASSDEEVMGTQPSRRTRESGAGDSRAERSRSRSIATAAPQDDDEMHSSEPFYAFQFASSAPDDSSRFVELAPVELRGSKVANAVVAAVLQLSDQDATGTLLALSLVSDEYRSAAQAALYKSVKLSTRRRLDLLSRAVTNNASLSALVHKLNIEPLDQDLPSSTPETLVAPLKALLDRLTHIENLDEDFTTGEWDVRTLTSGKEYPLTVSSPFKLKQFRSASVWWEVGALFSLVQAQPNLVELVLGGAAMDRDWAGAKLVSSLSSSSSSSPPPARLLESLEVAQVMHEDTLAVLLRAAGGGSAEHHSALRSLRVGFQSIGSTDDDTPRASIPAALALVGPSLTHLALMAPLKASDDVTGLLDELVAVLPNLEILEWTEATELVPVPLASSKFLSTALPRRLRVLRARSLVSLSTSRVLALLDDPEVAAPALKELDVLWANGTGEDAGQEPWYKERHILRIEEAAEEFGIKCRVGKSDEPLIFRRP
ncbi:uncharacterized protein JCM10292_003468 [Rhodotorula paludigena]|uniref:uncharacterized protein n=1 Tax=Rhodotorula paludigena TaxID=86838 RepID=UPI0031768AD5